MYLYRENTPTEIGMRTGAVILYNGYAIAKVLTPVAHWLLEIFSANPTCFSSSATSTPLKATCARVKRSLANFSSFCCHGGNDFVLFIENLRKSLPSHLHPLQLFIAIADAMLEAVVQPQLESLTVMTLYTLWAWVVHLGQQGNGGSLDPLSLCFPGVVGCSAQVLPTLRTTFWVRSALCSVAGARSALTMIL